MSSTFKKVWNIFTSVLIAVVVVVAFLLAGMRLFGFDVFKVLSGSMEPEIHTGAVVYVKKTPVEQIKKGDVITYMLSEDTYSTHRVVEVHEDEPHENNRTGVRYTVKGDANKQADGSKVMYSNVIGVVQFSLPYLGYVSDFLQTNPMVAAAAGILLLILIFLPEILSDDKEKKKKKDEEKSEDEVASPASTEAVDEVKEAAEAKSDDKPDAE